MVLTILIRKMTSRSEKSTIQVVRKEDEKNANYYGHNIDEYRRLYIYIYTLWICFFTVYYTLYTYRGFSFAKTKIVPVKTIIIEFFFGHFLRFSSHYCITRAIS